jgi:prevent-host-death family protein
MINSLSMPHMIKIEDILSLTEFHRHSRKHIEHLRATGRPQVLTVNGRAEIVVQDASAYQGLLEKLRQTEALLRKSSNKDVSSRTGSPSRRASHGKG